MPTEHSAGAVVFRREKDQIYFLLLQYNVKKEYWSFVKGAIEKSETQEQTVLRETQEETGIKDLQLIPGFSERISWFYKRDGKIIFKDSVFYLGETKKKLVHLSKEHIGFKWLPYKEACENLTFKNARNVLEKANTFLKKRKI